MQDRKRSDWKPIGIFLIVVILSVVALLFVTFMKRRTEIDNSKHYVAMITKSTESDFWKMVYAGADAAATEYNLTVTHTGPANEEDYQTQNGMVEKAVADGAEIIVFSAVDFNANAVAIDNAIAKGVRVVVIDSDVNSSQVSCRIGTDNTNAGEMVGRAVLASSLDQLNVGIVNFDKNSANGQERENGFRKIAKQDERVTIVDAINVLSTTEDAREQTMQMMKSHPQINVIVTFNEWTSLGVGYAVQEMGLADSTQVIAFDSNTVSVSMLETGEVDGLIVQNPYAMGYLGVEYAYRLINNIPLESTKIDTATTLVTKDNMFSDECQKVLFAFD